MMKEVEYYEKTVNVHAHSSVPWQQVILLSFLKRTGLGKNHHVLDLGSGIGNNIPTILRFTHNITTVDISQRALEHIRKKYRMYGIRVICSDATNTTLASESQDVVICTEVLEHCIDPVSVIEECLRVLRPGGYLVLSSPNYLNIAGVWKLVLENIFKHGSWDAWGNHSKGIESFMTFLKLRNMVKRDNLKIIHTAGGDLIRSFFPVFSRYYNFIDKHPFLFLGRIPIFKYLMMNFFILAQKKLS